MKKKWLMYLVVIFFSVCFALLYNRYAIFLSVAFMLVFPLISSLVVVLWKQGLRVQCRLQQRNQEVKKTNVLLLEVHNPTPFSLVGGKVMVSYQHELSEEMVEIPLKISVAAFSSTQEKISLCSAHCGRVRLQVSPMYVEGYFGLFATHIGKPEQLQYVGLPILEDLEPTEMEQEALAEKWTEKGQDIKNIREYYAGDSLKQIHWKLSAKKGQWLVKECEDEEARIQIHFSLYTKNRPTYAWYDQQISQLAGQSRSYLLAGIVHEVVWYHPQRQAYCTDIIAEGEDLLATLEKIMLAGVCRSIPLESEME